MLININNLFLLIIISFILNYFLIKMAFKFNYLDYPSNRKSHEKPTPFTGGFVLVVLFILLTIFFAQNQEIKLILISSALVGFLGLMDDKFNLNPAIKIIFLIAISSYVIFDGLKIISLGNYDFFGNLYLGNFSIIFTLLCILFLTNAFNYNDGIDGLTIFTFWTSSLLIIAISDNNDISSLLIYINTILLVLFFFNLSIFNLPKTFLGDTGSLLLGFFYSLLMIYLNKFYKIEALLLAWTVTYLVYEFLSINIFRILQKKNLVQPGSDHMHYALLRILKSKSLTFITINFINVIFFTLGFISFNHNSSVSFLLYIILFFPYIYFRHLIFVNIKSKKN